MTRGAWYSIGTKMLVTVVAVSGCASHPRPGPSTTDPLTVYSTILEAIREDMRETSRMVLEPRLIKIRSDAPLLTYIPAGMGFVEAFSAANTEDAQLDPRDLERLGVQPFERARFPRTGVRIDLNRWWADAVSHYGGDGLRVVRLSRPGFSPDGSSAVIYYGFGCGSLCGESRLAVLEWRKGQWRIISNRLMLIS